MSPTDAEPTDTDPTDADPTDAEPTDAHPDDAAPEDASTPQDATAPSDAGPADAGVPPAADCTSLHFDGIDDRASIPDVPSTSAFTIEGWVRGVPGAPYSGLFATNCGSLEWSSSGFIVQVFPSCNGTGTRYTNEPSPASFSAFPTGWFHVAMVVPAQDRVQIYLNGVLAAENNALAFDNGVNSTTFGSLAAHYRGPANPVTYSQVDVASLRVSTNARYSAAFVPPIALVPDASTAILYTFDEGTGLVLGDSSGAALDASLLGNPTWSAEGPGPGCAPAFSPEDLLGLELWLKADSLMGLPDNTPVSLWSDSRSGSTRAVSAAGGANRPAFFGTAFNGGAAIRFDGTDDELLVRSSVAGAQMTWLDLAVNQGLTVVAVILPDLGSGPNPRTVIGDSNNIVSHAASTTSLLVGRHAFGPRFESTLVPTGAFSVTFQHSDVAPSAANTVELFANNVSLGSNAATNSAVSHDEFVSVGTDLTSDLGRDSNFAGYLAELLVYSRELSPSEQASLHAYLQGRHAIP